MHGTHLVRHASAAVAPDIVVVGVDVEVPFVHEIDALPEIVGRMAVEGVGHEGSLLQVGRGQEAEYEVEQFGRKSPNLGCWSVVELPQVQGAIAAVIAAVLAAVGNATYGRGCFFVVRHAVRVSFTRSMRTASAGGSSKEERYRTIPGDCR